MWRNFGTLKTSEKMEAKNHVELTPLLILDPYLPALPRPVTKGEITHIICANGNSQFFYVTEHKTPEYTFRIRGRVDDISVGCPVLIFRPFRYRSLFLKKLTFAYFYLVGLKYLLKDLDYLIIYTDEINSIEIDYFPLAKRNPKA